MRLLFITHTRIGDSVLSTGVLGHLIEQHPGLRVTVACGLVSAPLFEAVPGLESILVVKKRPYNRHWVKLWWDTVGRLWDIVVDLRASATAYLIPAKRRYLLWRPDKSLHRVVELGQVLGLAEPPAPRVWLAPAHEAAADHLIATGGPVLAVGPAANWTGKQWPAERFAALVERLTGPKGLMAGARVAVLATARERGQCEAVLAAVEAERRIDLVGRTGLLESAACLSRCSLFVGNDSGLTHLAAASGVPTLGVFGPSREWRYAPWGEHCAYVRTRESYHELIGSPDFEARKAVGRLMDGLDLERAQQAAESLWQQVAAKPKAAATGA